MNHIVNHIDSTRPAQLSIMNSLLNIGIFKPGTRWPAGMSLVSRNHFHATKVCVCVCVHPRGHK